MGVFIALLLYVGAFIVPPILIYRSSPFDGVKRIAWVAAPIVAFFMPIFLYIAGLIIATKIFDYERTTESLIFGVEGTFRGYASLSMIILPWIIYAVHKRFVYSKALSK